MALLSCVFNYNREYATNIDLFPYFHFTHLSSRMCATHYYDISVVLDPQKACISYFTRLDYETCVSLHLTFIDTPI